jgi:hypothetical protein
MERKINNTSNYYFTQETEDAIVLYNQSSDPVFKSRLFTDKLYYPFYKMAENIIHTFKFYYMDVEDIEDLKLDIVTMIVQEKLQGFNPENGAKAFSYFQTIIKRWLINYNNNNYKKLKQVGSFDEIGESYETTTLDDESVNIPLSVVVEDFIKHCYDNFDELFQKEAEQKVADAVLTLFKTRHNLDIFKKKALYIYVREMTDCETPTLTKIVNKLRDEFRIIHSSYIAKGYDVQYNGI